MPLPATIPEVVTTDIIPSIGEISLATLPTRLDAVLLGILIQHQSFVCTVLLVGPDMPVVAVRTILVNTRDRTITEIPVVVILIITGIPTRNTSRSSENPLWKIWIVMSAKVLGTLNDLPARNDEVILITKVIGTLDIIVIPGMATTLTVLKIITLPSHVAAGHDITVRDAVVHEVEAL